MNAIAVALLLGALTPNPGPASGGDVVGPNSSTDECVARFDSTTGKLLMNSVLCVSDTGAVTGVTSLVMGGALSGVTTFSSGGAKFTVDANGNITKINNATTTWPSSNSSGVLTNNGSGTLTWASVAATTPGGSSGDVQCNVSSAFGACAGLTLNATTKQLLFAPSSPTASLMKITGGTLPATSGSRKYALEVTATHNSGNDLSEGAVIFDITSSGSSASVSQGAVTILLNAGYTGAANAGGMDIFNAASSTGTGDPRGSSPSGGNYNVGGGFEVQSAGTTGTGVGALGKCNGSYGNCYGFAGIQWTTARSNSTTVGVVGSAVLAKNGSSTTEKHVGGEFHALSADTNTALYAGLNTGAPTYATAAAIFDNGAIAAPGLIIRDNGTDVLTSADGGSLNGFQATTGTMPSWRIPTGIAATVPTKPDCAASTDEGKVIYLNDSDDGVAAQACMCGRWAADDTTYSWLNPMTDAACTL